jgi:glycosyltransferase involved in cell wall biosynthesis
MTGRIRPDCFCPDASVEKVRASSEEDRAMRLCYVLLSPTFGMHQYTADLANRMAQVRSPDPVDVHLVTTSMAPRDRYSPKVQIHTPVNTASTGFSRKALRLAQRSRARGVIEDLDPDIVHFSGPHIWNASLIRALSARGIPVVHTLHDLDPHLGTPYGFLIRFWNRTILRSAGHILVHGQTYRDRLLRMGLAPERVTWTPLLCLFVGSTRLSLASDLAASVEYEPWALFFGRLERYKGLGSLLTACDMMHIEGTEMPCLVVAGRGDASAFWAGALPRQVELRERLIEDEEALELFRRCGLVVLPYVDATQSAQIAAAYFFRKPVIVTYSGALPEYVIEGVTGRVIEPDPPAALARCLEDMLGDRDRLARMGQAGRSWYDEHRALEERELIAMYVRLARGRVPAAAAAALSEQTAGASSTD